MAKSVYFQLKSNVSIVKIINDIAKKYQIKKSKSEKLSVIYLDTFDWRLFRSNYILCQENKTLLLQKISNQVTALKVELSNLPVFANEFPNSNLKNIVNKIMQIRALQPVASIMMNRNEYDVLDDNKKTVLRLQVDSVNRAGKFVKINVLRGYENQLNSFIASITANVLKTDQKEFFNKILKINNKIPADYDPRINVQLKPDMRSEEATKLILNNLLTTLKRNEQGIIDDIDTEFLHDFRVASRRTRAALSQIKDVFDPEITNHYNKQFSLLGKKTNKLRDIDVYLLNKEKYINRLPVNMQKDIEPFFSELQKERNTEHKKLCRYLKSDTYHGQIQNWSKFLSTKSIKPNNAINANKPVISLAVSFIVKQYNKVMKLGNKITTDSPDVLYHKLRIQCKKLRYLLEFFSSLFPQDKINLLIVHLKKLQDNLGLYNDLFFQQKTLKSYSQKKEFNTDVILVLGYLIGKLNDEQIEVCKNFNNTFQEFSNKETIKIFNELFIKESRGQ